MTALRTDIDPDGLLEFSVVFTDRSLNHMSGVFQQVMRDIHAILCDVYNADTAVVVPGGGTYAMEAVARLRARGDRVAVCTNKPEGLAQTLLTRLGVRDAFGALIGADTLPVRKPDPAPLHAAIAGAGGVAARSVLVGDTVTDRETGRAAGVPVILVTFGPEGRAVEALSPEGLIHDYAGLLAEVDRLLP